MSGGKGVARAAGIGLLLLAASAQAHIGSPDVFFQGKAGPYPLLVSIRPPDVIPGVARIEIRSLTPGIQKIELTPTPMTGEAAKHPPVADLAQQAAGDPQYFTGSVWLMSFGSWEIHVRVSGTEGSGELPVPVPAIAIRTAPMQTGMGYFLVGMLLFLTMGLVAIVGAAVRESKLAPGVPSPRWNSRAVAWMAFTAGVLAIALWFGKGWWADDAAAYTRKLYKPLSAEASLEGRNQLDIRLRDPGSILARRLDDLVPDHGHLMHLFLLRWPKMDVFFHLHPEQAATGFFTLSLPALPGGRYRVYADVVHDNGFAETATGELELPGVAGPLPRGDDAGGAVPDASSAIEWVRDPARPIFAREMNLFSFRLAGGDAIEPYMGMGGHAEFVKSDGTVFAHVHPSGSVAMASMALASPEAMMRMHVMEPGNTVAFPLGLPSAGKYKVFVQIRHNGRVETNAFDFEVTAPKQ